MCGTLWKVRFQFHPSSGGDTIYLRVGQTARDTSFTIEEAQEFLERE